MNTLLDILKEENEKGRTLGDKISPLMSGRPSQEIKQMKGKAESNPSELLNSLGLSALPSGASKIEKLEAVYTNMISATGVPADSPAQSFGDFFETPERVVSPGGSAPGILIKLTRQSAEAVSKTGKVKASLRIFAFWFASVVTAINSSKPDYFDIETNRFKFQFAEGSQGILVFVSSGKPWESL